MNLKLCVFRLIGIVISWIGVIASLAREDRLIYNASPSFERDYQGRKYSKCKPIQQQLRISAIGWLIAFVSEVVCLINHMEYQNQFIENAFSWGILAIPFSFVVDAVIIFRTKRRLRKWIAITNGKKNMSHREIIEAQHRMGR